MSGDGDAAGSTGEAVEGREARVRAALASRPLLAEWGVSITSVAGGAVALDMPLPPDLSYSDPAHGSCDRSVVVALADAAAWLSAVSTIASDSQIATLEMKVDLVVPERALVRLVVTGEVIRAGRSLATVRSAVDGIAENGDAQPIGFIEATYIRI